jgi:hypothetical protein
MPRRSIGSSSGPTAARPARARQWRPAQHGQGVNPGAFDIGWQQQLDAAIVRLAAKGYALGNLEAASRTWPSTASW